MNEFECKSSSAVRIENWECAVLSCQGSRPCQDDALGLAWWEPPNEREVFSRYPVIAVADGMGGHSGGALAAREAVSAALNGFLKGPEDLKGRLNTGLTQANKKIRELKNRKGFAHPKMGCTLLLVAFEGDTISWASVGDSLLYHCAGGNLIKLNEDHSMAPILYQKVANGDMTEEVAANHPARNALRSAIVGSKISLSEIVVKKVTVSVDDCIMLATDGLHSIPGTDIEETIDLAVDSSAAIDGLKQQLLLTRHRSMDNATICLMRRLY